MASYTQIVDLFGIPACGKSTLVDTLDDANKNIKYIRLTKSYKKCSAYKKVGSIPFRSIYIAWKMTTLVEGKNINYYQQRFVSMVKTLICLKYAVKYSTFERVYVDHGVMQGIISLIGGHSIRSIGRFEGYATQLLLSCNNIHFVYCSVDIDTAIERMRNRGEHTGRLNSISDLNKLKEEYILEEKRFQWLAGLTDSVQILDTSSSIDNSVKYLKGIVNR